MDEKLRRLQRLAAEGVAPRLELLHALQRARRPLGDAWTGSRVPVVVALEDPGEDLLEFLAAFDPNRAAAHLEREGSEARLGKLGDAELRLRRDAHGFTLDLAAPTDAPARRTTWFGEPWRWRADHTYVTQLAVAGGVLARALSSGVLQVGPVYGGVSWERPLTGVVRALALHKGELLLVDDHLRRLDLETGAPRSELPLGERRISLARGYHGWVAVVDERSTVTVYDPHDRMCWSNYVGYGWRCLALGPQQLALAGTDLKVVDRATGLAVGAIERTSRVTGTWEDPESTMGMGRDVREIREYGPSLVGAAWRAGGHLLVANEQGGLSEHVVGPDGNRAVRRLGSVHPLGTQGPLVAGGPEDRVALTPGNCASTLAFGVGPGPRPVQLEAKVPANANAAISALAVSGRSVWIARTNGSVEHHELPGVALHPPK